MAAVAKLSFDRADLHIVRWIQLQVRMQEERATAQKKDIQNRPEKYRIKAASFFLLSDIIV